MCMRCLPFVPATHNVASRAHGQWTSGLLWRDGCVCVCSNDCKVYSYELAVAVESENDSCYCNVTYVMKVVVVYCIGVEVGCNDVDGVVDELDSVVEELELVVKVTIVVAAGDEEGGYSGVEDEAEDWALALPRALEPGVGVVIVEKAEVELEELEEVKVVLLENAAVLLKVLLGEFEVLEEVEDKLVMSWTLLLEVMGISTKPMDELVGLAKVLLGDTVELVEVSKVLEVNGELLDAGTTIVALEGRIVDIDDVPFE